MADAAAQFLTPAQYGDLEIENTNDIDGDVLSLMSPRVFVNAGSLYHVKDMRELARIVNSTISTVPEVFLGKLQGLTDEEFELFKTLNRAIAKLSGETYGRRRISRGGILSTMNMFRTIRSLCPNKDMVIFEIGPGTGYLGALLGLAGYRYVATDVTQALYLYQSHLFETLFGSDFLEGAHIPRDEFDLDRALSDRRIVHMPWWSYYTQFERLPKAGVDLVVSNRALLEMNDLARRYSMMMMRRLLSRSESGRHFIFEDWGSKEFTPASYGCHQFYENGFCIEHHDSATVVFSLQDRLGDKPFLKLPRPNEFHAYYPKNSAPGLFDPYKPIDFRESPLTQKLFKGRRAFVDQGRHGIAEIDRFLKDELGIDKVPSVQERFLTFTEAIYLK